MTSSHAARHARTGSTSRRRRLFLVAGSVVAVGAAVAALLVTTSGAAPAPRPVAADGSAVSLWSDQTVPAVPADPDTASTEVGTRFRTSVAGTVTALRFYRAAENAGPHAGHLWDGRGRLLATVRFAASTGAGWRAAELDRPVALRPGSWYVASYTAPHGRYADDQHVFSVGRTVRSGPLEARAGVYSYRANAYPTRTWRDSAYYADVVFRPGKSGAGRPVPPGPSIGPIDPAPTSAPTVPTSAPPTATPEPTTPAPTPPAPTITRPPAPVPPGPPTTGAWPGAGNTGWRPTGVALTRVSCPDGDYRVTKAGTVLDGLDIPCSVYVTADDVTIRRSRVTAGNFVGVRLDDRNRNLTVTDTEIVGKSSECGVALGYSNWTGLRLNLSGCADGVRIEGNTRLEDSWIHDLIDENGTHNDGAQGTGGSNVVFRHNRVDHPNGQTSCMLIGGEYGAPSNILVEGNYLNGGNYTVYLDPKGTNRTFRDNVFTRNHVYGPTSISGQYVWQGNRYEDGAALNR